MDKELGIKRSNSDDRSRSLCLGLLFGSVNVVLSPAIRGVCRTNIIAVKVKITVKTVDTMRACHCPHKCAVLKYLYKYKSKGEIEMTNVQKSIMDYINKNFITGSLETELVGEDKIKATDHMGDSMTLTMNLQGDILDADTKKVYGIKMDTIWLEVDRK